MKHFVIFITLVVFVSCKKKPTKLARIVGKQIAVSENITAVDSIEAFISPYRKHIDKVLDSTLAYSPRLISKEDGKYNTTAGNLMADIVLTQTNPIYKSRTGKSIDFVLLNHGGIRSIISKGNVNTRTAYEIMPFENKIVVVELNARSIQEMLTYLIKSSKPHPISGMQIIIDKHGDLSSFNIQGVPFNQERIYSVATNSYLVNGGDKMYFFKDRLSFMDTDYLIRNAIIDYFIKVDTITPVIDDRFIQLD